VLATSGEGRRIREAAGVSIRELADVLRKSPSTVARWERGETRPRADASERYEAALAALEQVAD
jgi:transcriptional regulator with XRE-family HTH domain